jgi:hypothetical protein
LYLALNRHTLIDPPALRARAEDGEQSSGNRAS